MEGVIYGTLISHEDIEGKNQNNHISISIHTIASDTIDNIDNIL